jgi:hypothetical protein
MPSRLSLGCASSCEISTDQHHRFGGAEILSILGFEVYGYVFDFTLVRIFEGSAL